MRGSGQDRESVGPGAEGKETKCRIVLRARKAEEVAGIETSARVERAAPLAGRTASSCTFSGRDRLRPLSALPSWSGRK